MILLILNTSYLSFHIIRSTLANVYSRHNIKTCFEISTINSMVMTTYSTMVIFKKKIKRCRGYYFTMYQATSQCVMRSDIHFSFWHNVKKSVRLKLKIMSVNCRFSVDLVYFELAG